MGDYEIPDVSNYRIENWSEEEREMWCGVYTPARRSELVTQRSWYVKQARILGLRCTS